MTNTDKTLELIDLVNWSARTVESGSPQDANLPEFVMSLDEDIAILLSESADIEFPFNVSDSLLIFLMSEAVKQEALCTAAFFTSGSTQFKRRNW